jgi:thiol-disulfide isomerase/thioredoxin
VLAIAATTALGSIALMKLYKLSKLPAIGVSLFCVTLISSITIGSLLYTSTQIRKEQAARRPANTLKNKMAPDVTFQLVGSNQSVTLKQAVGDGVAIFDFWAIWCGPCKKSLPKVSSVLDKYKGRGVKFYAVCVGPDADKEKRYLEENNIHATAVTCGEKSLRDYAVMTIPETLLIDKKGIVRSVHLGFTSNLESELSQAIDACLASSK